MTTRRVGLWIAAGLLLAACSQGADTAAPDRDGTTGTDAAADAASADFASGVTTAVAPTSSARPSTTTAPADAEDDGEDDGEDERDESCVVEVRPGDSLSAIADEVDGVGLDAFLAENRLAPSSVIHPGDELDVCIGNDVDDVTGTSLLPPGPRAVRRQQQELNELFAPYFIADLVVDGDSGPLTRQALCAARMGLGLPVNTTSMPEGGPEEQRLFEATSLQIPAGAPTWAARWILIDETCQVIYTGEGAERVVNVFPTSTGEAGHETRNVTAAAFRYDPAVDNGGWHDSTHFPVAADDPLNGNMYKPLYFSDGQAIHGANYVPPSPNSKGCARMFTWHHDSLISWLGLDDLTRATWRRGEIGVTVAVQGDYQPIE